MILSNLDAVSNGIQSDSARFLDNGWPVAWVEDDPDAASTSPEVVYEAAINYVDAGLSVIPIDTDEPSKSPCPKRVRTWKIYQIRLPRAEELRSWYECGGAFGLAVVAGSVSGGCKGYGLSIIDFDSFKLAAPWIDEVGKQAPGLIERLVMVQSPRPGLHVYYRAPGFDECQKLACAPAVDANGAVIHENGKPKKTTLIELKAEGGYCLVPPSPRRCHPRHKLYQLVEGSPPLTQVPFITADEQRVLLEQARKFNRWTEAEPKTFRPVAKNTQSDGNRPGDDFERRANWADILGPHGWVLVRRRGETEDWRRPGKLDGISATVNYADRGWFHVFSTNAEPFEDGRSYSKFTAYALLNHDGDFNKAAQALQDKGFGPKQLAAGKRNGSGTIILGRN